MLPQHSQKPFRLYYQFSSKHISVWCQKKHLHSTFSWHPKSHSWSNMKANVRIFLHIFVRKVLFQRHSKILSYGGGLERGLIISLRWLVVSALQNVLQFFILMEIFGNSTIFQHFDIPPMALTRWNFPDNLGFKGNILAKFLISHFLSV